MKRFILAICALFASICLFAQNDKADSIVGNFQFGSGIEAYKLKISKLADGTYEGAVYWVADILDKDGNKYKDVKNPDKSKRDNPLDQTVLFSGLRYDSAKKIWGGTKIYDPQRGIRAKMTAEFKDEKTVVVTGTLLGFTEKVEWVKIQE